MKKKTLFNEYNMLSSEGKDVDQDINNILREIVSKYVAMGYDPREIQNIVVDDITSLTAEIRLLKAFNIKKGMNK